MTRVILVLGCCAGLAMLVGCGSRSEPVRAEDAPAPVVATRVARFGPGESAHREAVSFQFVGDGVGELLRERLTPSAPAVEPIPFVTEPRPWGGARLTQRAMSSELASAIAAAPEPRVLQAEKPSPRRSRRVLDVPPLAAAAEPTMPAQVELPFGPLAFAIGPDPSQPPATELAPPLPSAFTLLADPTTDLSRQAMLQPVDSQRRESVPFMRPSDAGSCGFSPTIASLPVESEPPARATVLLPMLPLPVK